MKTFEEIEDFLTDALGTEMPNFSIETMEDGQIVVLTGLAEDAEGEIIDFDEYEATLAEELLEEEGETDD